jgi:hypothetical protein
MMIQDDPRLVDEAVPGVAAGIDDVGGGGEHAARQPGVAQKRPEGLDGVQLGRSGWQQPQREGVWPDEFCRAVPPGSVPQDNTMSARGPCATSARCRLIAGVSHLGRTRAAPWPC